MDQSQERNPPVRNVRPGRWTGGATPNVQVLLLVTNDDVRAVTSDGDLIGH